MGKKTWTDDEKQTLSELCKTKMYTNEELAEILGKSVNAVRNMKYTLRLNPLKRIDDLTGTTRGPLIIIGAAERIPNSRSARWQCKCTLCGTEFTVADYWLRHSDPYSHCKCTKYRYQTGENNTSYKHGGCRTPMYNRWSAMITRTSNTNADNYGYYGGRGIYVCEEWRNSYEVYRDWCLNNGFKSEYDTEMSVDRVNNDNGYSPDNCRVIPLVDQPKNRRNTKACIQKTV